MQKNCIHIERGAEYKTKFSLTQYALKMYFNVVDATWGKIRLKHNVYIRSIYLYTVLINASQ